MNGVEEKSPIHNWSKESCNFIKLILGLVAAILCVIWYFEIIKIWLIEWGFSEKMQDYFGVLAAVILYVLGKLNSEARQFFDNFLRAVYEGVGIKDLVGVILGLILFIYSGLRPVEIKPKIKS